MAVTKRSRKGAASPQPTKIRAAKPRTGAATPDFDPMAVARKPLPKLSAKKQGIIRAMFAGGADVKDVAAYLRVDILTVEELIEAQPDLRPSKARKADDAPKGDGESKSRGDLGRPTLYEEKFAAQAKVLASLGATDMEQAQFFGVAIRTLHRWKIDHPAFREALELGKEEADGKVEQSLYKRATGYTFDSEKIMLVDDEVVRVETLEHVPPDTKAAMFWLQNRRPGLWRNVNHIKHDVEPEGELSAWLKGLQSRANTMKPVEDDPDAGAPSGGTVPIADDDEG